MLAESLLEQARAYSLPEAIAVAAAVLYLVLAIREHIACWLFAGLSTAIFVYLFAEARLYMDSGLNAYYFAMAVYGWWFWTTGRTGGHELPVSAWPLSIHAAAVAGIVALSVCSGYLLDRFTDAAFPYADSLTTWASIWATFLVARKVLENWWYWLVIDAVSVFIYWTRDLQLTALLFAVYVVMIPFGLVSWTRSWRKSGA